MEVTVCQCRKCGRYHVFEKIGTRDIHVCECGERIERWTHRMEKCEIEKEPNEPLGAWKRNDTDTVWHGDNSPEWIPPKKLTKKVTIDVEAGKGFDKLLGVAKELSESIEDIPGLVMIDNDGKVNVVPVISIDSKMIVFRTITPYRKCDREELAKEYTDKLGIKCEVIDARTELVAVIDG